MTNMSKSREQHCCKLMRIHLDDDSSLQYIAKFREYGLRVLDGGSSYIEIGYCPWCGKKLPGSLREQWFKQLEHLGFDPGDPAIPDVFITDEWWNHV